MRLIPCRTCGNDNSPKARMCPRCGHPSYEPEPHKVFLAILAIIIFGMFAVLFTVYAILHWIIPGSLA